MTPLAPRSLALASLLLVGSFATAPPVAGQGEDPAELEAMDRGRWPSFRGYRARGVAEGFETAVEWDVDEGTNVLWRTPVPGLAHSSPVLWDGKLFLTTAVRAEGESELSSLYGSPGYGAGDSVENEGPHRFQVHCLDAETGEVLWTRTAHEGVPRTKRHPKSSHANPTPACDGTRVVAFFGSEGLHAFTHDGEPLWSRDLGVLDAGAPRLDDAEGYQWGFASSPVLVGDRVLVQCDVQGPSFVAALDAATGKDVWRVERDEEPTWCTPTVHGTGAGGRAQVLCNGYDHLGGYDLETGALLWETSGGGDVPVPTPVVAHGLVYMTSAHGRDRPLTAFRVDAAGTFERDAEASEQVAWHLPRSGIYMGTPLVYGEEVYLLSDGGILACFDALSGEEHYSERLGEGGSGFSASGVAADGKLYYAAESGAVYVVAAGPFFEVLATNELGEECMATPAVAKGRLYFRTRGHVVCVGLDD